MKLLLNALLKTYPKTWFSLVVLVIAIATGAIGLATVLNLSERASQVQNIRPWFDYTQYFNIAPKSDSKLKISDYKTLKTSVNYPIIAIKEVSLPLLRDDEENIQFIALDSLSAVSATPFFNTNQQNQITELSSTQLFGDSLLMNDETLTSIKGSSNEQLIKLISTQSVIIQNDLPNSLVLSDLDTLIQFELEEQRNTGLNANDAFGNINLTAAVMPGELSAKLTTEIYKSLPNHLDIVTPDNRFAATKMSESFQLNLLALGLLMFAVCMFIVLNAGNLLLHKRMPMLLTLRQLGFSRNGIVLIQLIELCSIAILVAVLATFLSQAIDQNISQQLTPIIGRSDLETPIHYRFLQIALVCVVGTLLAFLLPITKLKKNLIKSSDAQKVTEDTLLLLISIIAFVASLGFLLLSSWLPILLASTATFILSICGILLVLLPAVISYIKQLTNKRGVIVQLSTSAANALTPRTTLAFCAFFIAVTCNIGMNLMVDSFEQATQRWLDQRLIANAYLYSDSDFDTAALHSIEGHSIKLLPRLENKQTFETKPVDVFSYPSTQDYRDALSFDEVVADAWQLFEASEGVFVNQQFANIHNISIGDAIQIIAPLSKALKQYVVAGIIYDYGNPYGQVLMPTTSFDPESKRQVYALHSEPALSEAQLEELASALNVQIFSAESLVELSMRAFNDTFLITNVLNLVTLLVAAIALACTILVLMEDTRRQQFLLKSLGFSSFQIVKISLYQYVLLVIAGLLLATPFGIAVSWILINIINLNAFQWQYPLVIDLWVLVKIYTLSLSIVLISIVIPILSKSKRHISRELACID